MKCGISKSVSDESKACDALLDKTVMHLKHLAELIDAPKYDSHQFRTEHDKLEDEIDSFVKNSEKQKKYCHYRKSDEKEIQKATAIG
jgi:hypothetical protein